LLHINRCPVVAPMNVLRAEDIQRLQLDVSAYQAQAEQLRSSPGQWQEKLVQVYAEEQFAANQDPEQQLYEGFIGDRDRRLCEQVRRAEPQRLAEAVWPFDDGRLPELLFRYRARNLTATLSVEEQQRWRTFCQQRLTQPEYGAPNTLEQFNQALADVLPESDSAQQAILLEWRDHAEQLRQRYAL
jgi:exodeoxyribonuclease-1